MRHWRLRVRRVLGRLMLQLCFVAVCLVGAFGKYPPAGAQVFSQKERETLIRQDDAIVNMTSRQTGVEGRVQTLWDANTANVIAIAALQKDVNDRIDGQRSFFWVLAALGGGNIAVTGVAGARRKRRVGSEG